jgi:hypothetical protein
MTVLLLAGALALPAVVRAWGDEGHEVVALIAQHYLAAPALARVQAMLAGDASGLVTERTMASEAVWADRWRDSDRHAGRERYEQTRRWHYVDLALDSPDLVSACFGARPLPPGTAASAGPAEDCVVDKIMQFEAELCEPRTPPAERLLALQFLLHLVGDLHQPLHASDDDDEGGNRRRVIGPGLEASSLHHYWDTQFVQALDTDAPRLADALIARISGAELAAWQRGDAADWARESFSLARQYAYGGLPPPDAAGVYQLSAQYVQQASAVVGRQLQLGGVRLAMLLNRCLR